MSIFPNSGSHYSDSDRGILSRMEKDYRDYITINQVYWGEADIDSRFYSGDQSVCNELYGHLPLHQRKQFSFNRTRRIVSMVEGHQRKNRKSMIATPIENGDQDTADQFSKILQWNNQQGGVLETISDAFHGAIITGMNLLQVWMDYRSDPVSGNIVVDNCSYNSFLIDPYFKKSDLSDCNSIWKRSFLSAQEAMSLLPEHKEEVMELSMMAANKDGKFNFMPENYNMDTRGLMTYDEYYYRTYRTQKLLADTQTGETQEWRGDDKALREFLAAYPQIEKLDVEVPTVHLAIVLQGRVVYCGPQPGGISCYPFVPVFGYYEPQIPAYEYRIQGIVRGLRDPQFLYNRRKAIELDILSSQMNNGWIYKENALVNPKDVFLSGQGKGLALKAEANMTDVQRIETPQISQSMLQVSEILGGEMQQISGVNEELVGSAVDDKPGILSMLRQGAGLTTLQNLFDNLDRSQKQLGKIMIKLIQENFTPGKVQRIIEQEPSPEFYNKSFGRYDAVVEDGFNTSTQKQMQFSQLLQLRELGIEVPSDVLINAATLQNKSELVQAIQQREEQESQMQQQRSQIEMAEIQSRIELAQARSVADQGLGVERMSRVQENEQLAIERAAQAEENKAQAVQDRMAGLLDLVKAMKELDDIDLNQLEKVVRLSKAVKEEAVEEMATTQGTSSLDSLEF